MTLLPLRARPRRLALVMASLFVLVPLVATPFGQRTDATAQASEASTLPVVSLDALDPAQWSLSSLRLAPGQPLSITNRGVAPHTFTVAEWGISVDLPSLETVTVTVPADAKPGESFTFFCSVGNHRQQGQQGTITIVSPEEAIAAATLVSDAAPTTITMRDDYTFTPSSLSVNAGSFLQLVNTGVLEHHFVVDAWTMNVTVAPGQTTIVRVPDDAAPGTAVEFYCSVPGHRDKGMQGTLTIEAGPPGDAGAPNERPDSSVSDSDLLSLVPPASMLGKGWRLLRDGDALALSPTLGSIDVRIFPGNGRSAIYLGPDGSRVAIILLPLAVASVPTNQVESAMFDVQAAFMTGWSIDTSPRAAYATAPNPPGCDIVSRTSGVTDLYTLPAGSTSCQMRGPGIAIFVAVEGTVEGLTGVAASDELVRRIIAGAA